MQFQPRESLMSIGQHPDIRENQGIHADVTQLAEVVVHVLDFVVIRQDIRRHIDPGLPRVGILYRLVKFFEAEVFRGRAHTEGLAPGIDRISSKVDGGFHVRQVPSRGEDLGTGIGRVCGGQVFLLFASR